jgi:hypothetical protein
MPQFVEWHESPENKGQDWILPHFYGGNKQRQKRHIGTAGAPFGTK